MITSFNGQEESFKLMCKISVKSTIIKQPTQAQDYQRMMNTLTKDIALRLQFFSMLEILRRKWNLRLDAQNLSKCINKSQKCLYNSSMSM